MSRRRKITFAAIALVLAALVGWPFAAHYSAKSRVENYKRQLKAKGEKLTIAELAPRPQIGDANGARRLTAAIWQLGSAWSSNSPPTMKRLGPGRALVAWKQEILPNSDLTNVWPGLRETAESKHDVLADVRGALESPLLDFNLDYSQGFKTLLLPHLSQIGVSAQCLSAAAILELHEGRTTNALEDVNALAQLVAKYRNEPLLISELVRIGFGQIALNAAWEALQSPGLSDEHLVKIQTAWESVDLFSHAAAALSMERVMGEKTFAELRTSYSAINAYTTGSGASQSSGFAELAEIGKELIDHPLDGLKGAIERYPRYWAWKWWGSYEDELVNMQLLQAGTEAARSVQQGKPLKPVLEQLGESADRIQKAHPGAGHWPNLFPADGGFFRRFLERISELETQRRLLVTAVALKRYQQRQGGYPPDLAALTPEFLPETPRDAMDGQPLRYHPGADGSFLLYSVGEDGQDNGGDATSPDSVIARKQFWRGRDAVWPQAGSLEEAKIYFAMVNVDRNQKRSEPTVIVTNGMSVTMLKELETVVGQYKIIFTNNAPASRTQ